MSGSAVDPAVVERGRRDRFEWLVLALLFALGFAVLAGLVLRTLIKGGTVTGGDSILVVDSLQYLNWLRQASEHLAAANLYDFAPLRYTFVHPGLIAAGMVHRLGVPVPTTYALVKPFAIVALFLGCSALVHRHLQRRGDRRLALVLALFYCAPASALVGWSVTPSQSFEIDFAGGEMWTGAYLWGYSFTAIAVALVPLGLLAWERAQRVEPPRWALLAAGACALFCSWMQPWQGATLAGTLAACELVGLAAGRRSFGRIVRTTGPILLAAIIPLAYYWLLSHLDPAWELAGTANNRPRWPEWVLLATALPLALPAGFAYRRGDFVDPGGAALRLWPLVALAVYYAPLGTFPFHAAQGVQFPLAVLAVIAWRRHLGERPIPRLAAILVAVLLVVPGTAYRVQQMRNAVNAGLQAFFLTSDEREALRFIERSKLPGGVATQNYLATVIPAWTGKQVWFGAGSWSPDFDRRRKLMDSLFSGDLNPDEARTLLVRPGAGFLLDDCRSNSRFRADVRGFTDVAWKRG